MNNITRAKFLGQKSTGGGTSNHQSLSNLAWANSGHTGTASKIAGFDDDGKPTYYDALTLTTNWTILATLWSTEPTLYDTQATYKVYEYTYGTTKYYRRVYDAYNPTTDTFYTTSALTTAVCSRTLSI